MQVKEQYLACLKEHASQAEACRELAKTYLECRMDRCGTCSLAASLKDRHICTALLEGLLSRC